MHPRLGDRLLKRSGEPLPGHLQKVERRHAGRVSQIGSGVPSEVDHAHVFADDHAGGRIDPGGDAVGLSRHVETQVRGLSPNLAPFQGLHRGQRDRLAELQRECASSRFTRVDTVLLVEQLEERPVPSRRFGGAENQEAGRVERIVEHRYEALLRGGAEVDEHVPAQDEVQTGEGRVVGDILFGEDAHLPQAFLDLIALGHQIEEPLEAQVAHLRGDGRGVGADTGPSYVDVVDIGRE